jgi:5'-3' exonuclease
MSLLIIDGDVLAYNACKNKQEWLRNHRGISVMDFIALDDDGKQIDLEATKEEDAKYLEACWNNFERLLSDLQECTFTTDYIMAVKGIGNYRSDLYPEYKMNRHADPKKQNHFVPVLRKLAVHHGLAIEAHGREADDLIRIWAEECKAAGIDYIVCSIDKDLKCISGNHYLIHKNQMITMTEDASLRFYYEQLLKGDPTDNIPGIPRVGDVKAAKFLAECNTESEFQEAVINAYKVAYGDEWENYLLSNGKMIYLQKNMTDYFSIKEWSTVKTLRQIQPIISEEISTTHFKIPM